MPSTTSTPRIDELRSSIHGRVMTPGDAGYDEARAVFVGGIDRHPAVIIQVADTADIKRVLSLARETGLPLAVRSGGHADAGPGVVDDGIVLDVRLLKGLEIDTDARVAWAGSGLTALEYTTAAAEHGLATGFGDTGSVGLGGLVLGGGVGYLVRKHGLTIDDLLAAEVVTADGQVRQADAKTEPELFWAIRGGGGNFGVATRFKLRLHELGTVTGGMLLLPASADTINGFITAAEAAPEELSTIANVMPVPPMPFVPEAEHGKVAILAMLVHSGEPGAGERAIAPFRSLAKPIVDMVKEMPYPEIYPPEDPDYRPLAVARTLFMDTFDRSDAEVIIDRLEKSDAPLRAAQLRVLGGAATRVPADATAYAHRDRRIMVNVASFYVGEDDRPVREAWVEELSAALSKGDDRGYVNFLADEGETRVRAAYPGTTWDRLRALKLRYDPDNLFRRNQNIPPASL
jgi:hypothetical protein